MHYATMAALMISNVTTLVLAILLAGPFFGGALGEIAYIGETQRLNAATRSTYTYTEDPGEMLLLPSRRGGGGGGGSLPAAPTGLAPYRVAYDQVWLQWADNANNETGFSIERTATTTQSWAVVGTAPATSSPTMIYYDQVVAANSTYLYRVRAYNGRGYSAYSNTVTVVTPPDPRPLPATNLRLINQSPWHISQQWTDASSNETGFMIDRSTSTGAFLNIGRAPANNEFFSDWTVQPNTLYTYRVVSYNLYGSSGWPIATTTSYHVEPYTPTITEASSTSPFMVGLLYDARPGGWANTVVHIERATSGSPFIEIATRSYYEQSYQDRSVLPSTSYMYRMRTSNDYGMSEYSNAIQITTPANVPLAPTMTSASSTDPFSVNIGWHNNSSWTFGHGGWRIERMSSGGPFVEIANLTQYSTWYHDTAVTPGTSYCYRLRQYNDIGLSEYSNNYCTVTLYAAPSNLVASSTLAFSVNMIWQNNSPWTPGMGGWFVERAIASSSFSRIAELMTYSTSYLDTGLTALTVYSYRVCQWNISGCSPYSNIATATTTAP